MYADNDLLATYHRIGQLMIERFAGRTGDVVHIHVRELGWITGKNRRDASIRLLQRLVGLSPLEMEFRAEIGGKSAGLLADFRGTSAGIPADIIAIRFPNFSKKQFNAPKNEGARSASEFRIPSTEYIGEEEERASDPKSSPTDDADTEIPDPIEGFKPQKLVNLLGAGKREEKLAWLEERLPAIVAAARAKLAEAGHGKPDRGQLSAEVRDRLFAFWRTHQRGGDERDGGRPSAAQAREDRGRRAAENVLKELTE